MTTQATEFHRRYTNVKNRNESFDKVILESKKQLALYKDEIEKMLLSEEQVTIEKY